MSAITTRIKMNSDASVIDRRVEALIGKVLDSDADSRSALIAEINELSASRTRLMRPKQRRHRQVSPDARRAAIIEIIAGRKAKDKRIPA